MKNLFTKHVLPFGLVALILVAGCNSQQKPKRKKVQLPVGKEAYVEVEVFDAVKIKDQIVETIRKMPSEKEVVAFDE
jgi:hypothetical protein